MRSSFETEEILTLFGMRGGHDAPQTFLTTVLKLLEGGSLILLDMGFFEPSVMGGGGQEGPHYNFVVVAPMIMKCGTGVKHDVLYTMVAKRFMTSLLLRHYDVMTCILANAQALTSDARNSQTLLLIALKFGI